MHRRITIAAILGAGLLLASAAVAQTPQEGYQQVPGVPPPPPTETVPPPPPPAQAPALPEEAPPPPTREELPAQEEAPGPAVSAPVEEQPEAALPFTGLDLGLVALAAVLLLLTGLLLRRHAAGRGA